MNLVLFPGLDGTGKLFSFFTPFLPADLHPVVASFPNNVIHGYGDLLEFGRAFPPAEEDFVLLGESFSGPLVLMLAALHPARLKGVILGASFVRLPIPGRKAPSALIRPWFLRMAPKTCIAWFLMGRRAAPGLKAFYFSLWKTVPLDVLAARLRVVMSVDARKELQACPVPILYLKASRDRLVSGANAEMIRMLHTGVRVEVIPGPHLILQTRPKPCVRAIQDFISTL